MRKFIYSFIFLQIAMILGIMHKTYNYQWNPFSANIAWQEGWKEEKNKEILKKKKGGAKC